MKSDLQIINLCSEAYVLQDIEDWANSGRLSWLLMVSVFDCMLNICVSVLLCCNIAFDDVYKSHSSSSRHHFLLFDVEMVGWVV